MTNFEKEQFALEVYRRLAPGAEIHIEAGQFDTGVRVTTPMGSARFAVHLVCHRYREDNAPFADRQTVDELIAEGLLDPLLIQRPEIGAAAEPEAAAE